MLILGWNLQYEVLRYLRDGGHEIAISESAWHFYCSARFSSVFDLVVFDVTGEKELTPVRVALDTGNDLILLSPALLVPSLTQELRAHDALRWVAIVPIPFQVEIKKGVKVDHFADAAKDFGIRI